MTSQVIAVYLDCPSSEDFEFIDKLLSCLSARDVLHGYYISPEKFSETLEDIEIRIENK